ncbi:MAG TPA: hypothetical protein P5572_12940 [Phycisphaerae bacterium]|nr:hypothetical protein [Phycisphaerales bacterium]HRX85917.1 hypothetical protein [Phycisphaerae bacterium]
MKHLLIGLLATWGTLSSALAAAPGPLDGMDIPTDYAAAALVGVQTNRTGAGDVTDLAVMPVYTAGSELDALYLAKDNSYLYVGLAGNLIEVGNDFIILIDNPFSGGQTELRTEGVGGPPFALQLAGREVIVNTNGTPLDGSDDTYTVTPNSGTLLPTCGDPSFTGWDYALAVDGAGGTLYGHDYLLFDAPFGNASAGDVCHFGDERGRVPCDPTPDNPNDAGLPVWAIRNFVFSSPIGDGNETFEGGGPQFGYPRGGFDNSNTSGVTEVSATQAAAANTGIEIAIPLATLGLFSSDTFHLMVISMDADEYQETAVSEGFGTVLNQALPALTGASCNPPQGLGLRPDLSSVASCLTVDLNTVATISPSAVLDGVIDPADYGGGAPVATQSCPTSNGDQARAYDVLQPVQDGSELDAMYAANDDSFLYLGLTGNLAADDTSLNVFVDTGAGGEHELAFDTGSAVYDASVITDFTNFTFSGRYQRWVTGSITSGVDGVHVVSTDYGGAYYDINPNMSVPGATTLTLDLTLHPNNLADTVIVILVDEDLTERAYRFDGLTANGTYSLSVPLSAYSTENAPGSVPGLDTENLSFFHITGSFGHGNPGVTLDMTFHQLALLSVTPGAAPIVTMSGDQLANGPLPADEAIGYDYAYGINLSYQPYLAFVDFFDLVNDAFTYRGSVVPDYGDSVLADDPGGLVADNPNGMAMAVNNWNTTGVISCPDNAACHLESAATVAQRAREATRGFEMAIPLADLGLSAADLPRIIHVWAEIGDELGFAYDQSLPSMRNASGAGNQVSNPGNAPANFTNPGAPPATNAVLSDFSNFALTDTYDGWTTASFTSGATAFTVQGTDWGGGYYDLDPNVDASSATDLELQVTLNPSNQTDKIVVVLTDDDGTERVYRFENLSNGTQTLALPLSRYVNDNNPGTVPGLDLANISFFHIAGAYHNGNPGVIMDVTFDNLALIGAARNYEARAAAICLGTVDGDADCDGDNDLVDIALLQRCVGVQADPVLPMACERLDFVKDGQVDTLDLTAFEALLDGPQ